MKEIRWVGSSKKDIKDFPDEVRQEIGFSLYLAQCGTKAANAAPMLGFGGARVLEVVVDDSGDTYRAVYIVKFVKAVYVLHAFQKKSIKGIATPRPDIDLIKSRLKSAQEHYGKNYEPAKKRGGHGHEKE